MDRETIIDALGVVTLAILGIALIIGLPLLIGPG